AVPARPRPVKRRRPPPALRHLRRFVAVSTRDHVRAEPDRRVHRCAGPEVPMEEMNVREASDPAAPRRVAPQGGGAPSCASQVLEGPRERMRAVGTEGLSDAELLAVLLGTGARSEPVGVLASRVLHELGGLAALSRVGPGALERVAGVGPTKASRIVAAVELGRRVVTRPLARGARIGSSRDVDAALRPRLADADVEHFIAIALDAKNRPIGELEIARGG